MHFYKLTLKTIPRVFMAHCYETDFFENTLKCYENMIEISYIESGDIKRIYGDGETTIFKAPCVGVSFFNREVHNICEAPFHRHFTFAMEVDFDLSPISPEEIVRDWQKNFSRDSQAANIAILPDYLSDPKLGDLVCPLIQKIIHRHSVQTGTEQLSCVSDIFAILSMLTGWSISYASSLAREYVTPEENAYCTRAAKYIARNIGDKIYVGNVAAHLGLSVGHLSRIFKAVTGYSVIEYSNRQKITLARQLLAGSALSVREAAGAVGIQDEKYFCRLFKQYTGMTTTAYKETLQVQENNSSNQTAP